jgi:hypothetical protein
MVRVWHDHPSNEPNEVVFGLWPTALKQVRTVPELRDFTMAQLLALSLRGGLGLNEERGSLADPDANHPFGDYVAAADRQLEEAPELRSMAEKLVTKG